ncbi:TPA: hypothetical protein ACNU17_003075 [Aeromonas salmonicida subsp. pectinolytica]
MNTQVQVVVDFIKANVNGTVNKTKFAAENNVSRRTLDRYVAKFEVEARQIIEVEKAEPKVQVIKNAAITKRDLAASIYSNGVTAKMKRSEIIAMMVSGAGLTPAGASTYISNFKTGKWEI